MAIDLDALAADLVNLVDRVDVNGDCLVIDCEATRFLVYSNGTVCDASDSVLNPVLDIIARHVAPPVPDAAALRERIAELRQMIIRFGNHRMQYGMSYERGVLDNAEENRLLAEQLSEEIDAVLAVIGAVPPAEGVTIPRELNSDLVRVLDAAEGWASELDFPSERETAIRGSVAAIRALLEGGQGE